MRKAGAPFPGRFPGASSRRPKSGRRPASTTSTASRPRRRRSRRRLEP